MPRKWLLKKDWFILRFAIPFYKDALQWRVVYGELEEKGKFDDAKLIHIATLSMEMLMKSILLLSFYDYRTDGRVLVWLKNSGHKIATMYNKIDWRYSINLSSSQKDTINKWSDIWINVRYMIDAFFNSLNTVGIASDLLQWGSEEAKIDLENYKWIFDELQSLCEDIFSLEYWLPLHVLKRWKVQIPEDQLEIMQIVYK